LDNTNHQALYPDHWGRKTESQDKPSKEFHDRWLNRLKEVVNNYKPDYVWFDFGVRYIHEKYKRDFLSFYYNKEKEWNSEVVVSYKWHDLPPGSGLLDLEQGAESELTHYDWITDTTVHDGSAWAYMKDSKYKSTTELVHYLIDNVSKNGYMLLNIGPKPDGTIPEEDKNLLEGIGKWLEVNGESIFDTETWDQYGEGPTKIKQAGPFSDLKAKLHYTGKDFRFTTKGNSLYATSLGWPNKEFTIESMDKLFDGEIQSVELLGSNEKINWKHNNEGLHITRPDHCPCEHAYSFKINRKEDL
jgi:alpha-L-fucosidase